MEEKKFCPYCGERLTGRDRFCGKCGKRITLLSEISPRRNKKGRHAGIIFMVSFFLVVLGFCGGLAFLSYTYSDQKQIIGAWFVVDEDEETTERKIILYENGAIYDSDIGMTGKYVMENDTITANYDSGWAMAQYVYKYELDQDVLTLELDYKDEIVILERGESEPLQEPAWIASNGNDL